MDKNTLIQLATLISIIGGVISLLIPVRAYKRQVNSQFLLEYTRRIDEIMRSLPQSVWAAHLFPGEELPAPSSELRMDILRCLNLFSQIHYFSNRGYIPKNVWRMGEVGLQQLLRSPLFIREWETIEPFFASNRAFCRYVKRAQQPPERKQGVRRKKGMANYSN